MGMAGGGSTDDASEDQLTARRILQSMGGEGYTPPRKVHGHAQVGHSSAKFGRGPSTPYTYSNYGVDIPVGSQGTLSLGAMGNGVVPSHFNVGAQFPVGRGRLNASHTFGGGSQLDYNTRLFGGDLGVGVGSSQGVTPDSVRASYHLQFADGGSVAPPYAGGGLSELPIPDTMFDESRNGGFDDGYAGGGLIAFAGGGDTDPMGWLHGTTVRGGQWGAPRSYGGHTGLDLALSEGNPVGAVAPGRVVDAGHNRQSGNYVIVQHPDGHRSSYAELASIGVKKGDTVGQGSVLGMVGSTGATSTGPHVHFSLRDPSGKKIDPTPYVRGQRGFDFGAQGSASANSPAASGPASTQSYMDLFSALQKQFGPSPEEKQINSMRMARAKELMSSEYQEKMRKQDMWNTLAQIGFNMASSRSPYLLQAVGDAAAAALPGAQVAKKEREALKDRALDAMGAMNGQTRRDNLALFSTVVDIHKSQQQQAQFETTKALDEQRIEIDRKRAQAEADSVGVQQYKAMHPELTDQQAGVKYFTDQGMSAPDALNAYFKALSVIKPGSQRVSAEQVLKDAQAAAAAGGGASQAAPAAGPWTQYQQ